ncbi:MAG: hypothetical protein QXX17_07060 [Conexivisphaerales archaeon]
MLLVSLGALIALAAHPALADSGGSGLSLSYLTNATDQGGQPLAITAVTNGFTASKITWYQNGSVVGNGANYVLQPDKVGRYNITVVATTASGGSYLATSFFFVNPPISIASFNVPQSTSSGRITASVSVYGGTPPFNYVWSLNGQTQIGCGSSTQCAFNLTRQGMNNISVTVFDSANSQVQTQVAHVLYQQAAAGSSNSMLLYGGAAGGVVVAGLVVYLFVGRRKTGIEEKTTALPETGEARKPFVQQQQQQSKGYSDYTSASRTYQKPVETPAPVVKIVKEPEPAVPKQQPSQTSYTPSTYRPTYAQPQPQPKPSYTPTPQRTVQPYTASTYTVNKQVVEKSEPTKPEAPQTTQPVQQKVYSPQPAAAATSNDPAEWIMQCVAGKGFWPLERGLLPKSELEKEFKKKFPDITLATFNSIFYDLVYKDKISSEIVNGQVMLKPGGSAGT